MLILGCLRMVEMHDGCMITVGNDNEFLGVLCYALLCHM